MVGQVPPAESGRWFLSCQSRFGKTVHLDWSVELIGSHAAEPDGGGTLRGYLSWKGLALKKTAPTPVVANL